MPELNHVEVHAVLEPLKVRLITKGPAFMQWYGKRLQKILWSFLQQFRAFPLTGRTLEVDDLYSLVARTKAFKELAHFEEFVSGDFQGATDSIKIDYTKLSLEPVLEELKCSSEEAELFRAILYEQVIHYPKPHNKESKQLPPFLQARGQLMGSVLSFPHLCMINATCYQLALEEYLGRAVPVKDLPVLINGDDILFMCDDRLYSLWLKYITEAGFKLSVGKNYRHKKYVMINSQTYYYDGVKFHFVDYLNIGHLTGQSRHSGRDNASHKPIWDLYNRVMRGSCNRKRAHARFLTLHRSEICDFTIAGEFNLFVDRRFGGLGFDLYPEIADDVHFTRFQRQFGHYLRAETLNYEGELSGAKVHMGIVAEKKIKDESIPVYHFGGYQLRTFENVGTLESPIYTLAIGEDERIGEKKTFRSAILSAPLDQTEKGDMVIVHPQRSILRSFRQVSKEKLCTSIRPLLQAQRVYVESIVTDPNETL
jgi:hypothetical protein